jgi:hypothetical protein
MRVLLAIVALMLVAATAWAAGCPSGSHHHCVQTKKGVQCYCR